MSQSDLIRFPDGFVWGTATASYQIEGAIDADGRGPSIWDTFSHTPGKVLHGDTGNIACDAYHRVDADLDLMAGLGAGAYRFSIAWPRIQPSGKGRANQAGLDHYKRVVGGLRERGIVPAVTLYHWDLPQALQDEGGWDNRDIADRFADYTALVAEALGEDVGMWITLNEPWVSAFPGHAEGRHAPGFTDVGMAVRASHNLLRAHGAAVAVLRDALPQAKVGITLNLSPVSTVSGSSQDEAAARRLDGNLNRWFLDATLLGRYPQDMLELYRPVTGRELVREGDLAQISAPLDFLGINYYYRQTVRALRDDEATPGDSPTLDSLLALRDASDPALPRTLKDWAIEPDGLTDLLTRIGQDYPRIPIYITENGAAFADYVDHNGEVRDYERIDFLWSHFRAAHRAIEAGVPLAGYFVWSLLDNFEWADGYSQRFGLVFVDYHTQERIPKASARWFTEVAQANAVSDESPSALRVAATS